MQRAREVRGSAAVSGLQHLLAMTDLGRGAVVQVDGLGWARRMPPVAGPIGGSSSQAQLMNTISSLPSPRVIRVPITISSLVGRCTRAGERRLWVRLKAMGKEYGEQYVRAMRQKKLAQHQPRSIP